MCMECVHIAGMAIAGTATLLPALLLKFRKKKALGGFPGHDLESVPVPGPDGFPPCMGYTTEPEPKDSPTPQNHLQENTQ